MQQVVLSAGVPALTHMSRAKDPDVCTDEGALVCLRHVSVLQARPCDGLLDNAGHELFISHRPLWKVKLRSPNRTCHSCCSPKLYVTLKA